MDVDAPAAGLDWKGSTFLRPEVIFVKDMLFLVLALVSVITAVFSWIKYTGTQNIWFLVAFVVFILATVAFGGLFLSGRVNKTEDIHITE